MVIVRMTRFLLVLVIGITVSDGIAQTCPCDANVDASGGFPNISIADALCIAACKAGDCSCCISSCDINCDGVVDDADIADDFFGTDSTFLCMFQGGTPATCCPIPSGACCDTSVGTCQDDVLEADCDGPNSLWSSAQTCADVSCPTIAVPAVSTWGLIAMTLLMSSAATLLLRENRCPASEVEA